MGRSGSGRSGRGRSGSGRSEMGRGRSSRMIKFIEIIANVFDIEIVSWEMVINESEDKLIHFFDMNVDLKIKKM
jgi:hypothetical protein